MSEPPVLRIVAGGVPTDEQTAALTAVIAAAAAVEAEPAESAGRWRTSASPAGPWAHGGWLADARRSALRRQR